MRRVLAFAIVIFISLSFINCSEDEVTYPENNGTNHNPAVNILNPADDASFTEGETISFLGLGLDDEKDFLPDSMLVWKSDHDDTIGTGNSFYRDDLSVNSHVITLIGTDADGYSDLESISIQVNPGSGPDNYIFITVPATSGYPMGLEGISDTVHTVSLDEFHIGKYEVTYELWLDVMTWAVNTDYIFEHAGSQGYGGGITTVQHPVTQVSWRDCIVWCNAYSDKEGLEPVYYTSSSHAELYKDSSEDVDIGNDCLNMDATGFRLPTEAEWEYAARYIDGTNVSSEIEHSGYNLYPDIGDCAWYMDNSRLNTHPVGKLHANSLGAKDMSGNVKEHCWDRLGAYPNHHENNPLGPDNGYYRILRGGCWRYNAVACRTAYRSYSYPGAASRYYIMGFRLCRSGLVP